MDQTYGSFHTRVCCKFIYKGKAGSASLSFDRNKFYSLGLDLPNGAIC